eukprot:TRINITY_DN17220_c0_g2_i2.p1 TRINITY_DN17220_c0_g2~~TRINITY_DN17220_c0_g2_i2.p1  ORF type:complete len:686 (+),score=117.64 TRINITY_DN17220_c0_g2_i2:338-2395(+)
MFPFRFPRPALLAPSHFRLGALDSSSSRSRLQAPAWHLRQRAIFATCRLLLLLPILLLSVVAVRHFSGDVPHGRSMLDERMEESEELAGCHVDGVERPPAGRRADGHKEVDRWQLHTRAHMEAAGNGSCWSLLEHVFYFPVPRYRPSHALVKALRAYEKMHKRCVADITAWEKHLGQTAWAVHVEKSIPGFNDCKYLVWEATDVGLGNRMLGLLSAFTYALLTNRALLVTSHYQVTSLLCNPFPFSSWQLPTAFPLSELQQAPVLVDFMKRERGQREPPQQQQQGDGGAGGEDGTERTSGASGERTAIDTSEQRESWDKVVVHFEFWYGPPEQWILTEAGHRYMAATRWWHFKSDQFIVPSLYLNPELRAKLDLLFPARRVQQHLSRYLLHPLNLSWERIVRLHKAYIAHASYRVGIQVRTFGPFEPGVTGRIIECAQEKKVLPLTASPDVLSPRVPPPGSSHWSASSSGESTGQQSRMMQKGSGKGWWFRRDGGGPAEDRISVFVASLHSQYSEGLKDFYRENPTNDGSIVGVVMATHEEAERHELRADVNALVEIWLLAMSDTLLISFMSTFGYVASGLSGRPTFFLNIINRVSSDGKYNWKTNGRPVCEAVQTSEACQHSPARFLNCTEGVGVQQPGGPVPEFDMATCLPYVRVCQDLRKGVVVIPKETPCLKGIGSGKQTG